MPAVECISLTKIYGKEKILAIDDLSFSVKRGEIFGLIGPDGAGKTSIFRILATLLLPDSGKAFVEGYDCTESYISIRKIIGYMPGKFSLYQDLTVEENLNFFATLFGTSLRENYDLVRDIYEHIEPFKNRRAGNLSGGMKQKLALCCALIHKPTVLFLDEPTTGVDPVSRKEFWNMLKRLQAQNITMIISTPYMDEAELCDRVALIHHGKILSIETPERHSSGYVGKLFAVKANNMIRLLKSLRSFEKIYSCHAFGESAHVTFLPESENIQELLSFLHREGFNEIEIAPVEATIEDTFIQLLQS
ncbi:MAG: ABC transporter ATP-binding protein [Crocinitomicaceae bacterium]|nr:ABC transporter ATP-binding protein [Crocinitomicaceae bacterium]